MTNVISNAAKNCNNCAHSTGFINEFKKCVRTGFYIETEMQYGGRCAGGEHGQELRLWSPRTTLFMRIASVLRAAK